MGNNGERAGWLVNRGHGVWRGEGGHGVVAAQFTGAKHFYVFVFGPAGHAPQQQSRTGGSRRGEPLTAVMETTAVPRLLMVGARLQVPKPCFSGTQSEAEICAGKVAVKVEEHHSTGHNNTFSTVEIWK